MSGKATLYFVVTKVTAPKGSSFNLVLSVGDTKVTLGSSRSRGTSFNLPYKIAKEVTNHPDGSSSYRSCVAQINFLDGETTTSTGLTRIKPEDFLNASDIDVREYTISVPNVDAVSAFIGIALIPDGGAAPSNYGEFGETAKVVSTEARQESDSSSHHSHHRSSQPEQPAPTEGQMEGAEEIVESESGRKHRRKRGTKDTSDGTFISDGGHTHKRRHRSHTTQPTAPPVETPPPAPEPTPSEPTPDGQMEGAEEIVESESGRKHRRKRGTKDTSDGTFISDGGHTHKRRHRHKTAESSSSETKTEEPKPEEPKQEEVKPEAPKEEAKPEPPKQEEPKPEEQKVETPKSEEVKQEEPKNEESKPVEDSTVQRTLQIDETQQQDLTEENQQLAKKVSDLKDVVEKQTNWIRSLYSKLNEHGISQSLKPNDPRFPAFPTDISDFSRTLRPSALTVGGTESPSQLENDLQKACQTGEYNQRSFPYRSRSISGNGVNNIEEENYENPNDNYDDGPLRHFHFARNEIKEPEEPIYSTSNGDLTLSYSIRNDCFFRPHYNFEMLDISGRFSFEVFQSPFEIEEESLSIECRYNPTIEYNSGDGGYQDIPTFSPTRSRFQTEIKGRSYFVNENQGNDQYSYSNRTYQYEPKRVFSPTKDPNSQLSISNIDSNDTTSNDVSHFSYRNQQNYVPRINEDFHSAFYNSSDRRSQKLTEINYPGENDQFNNPKLEDINPNIEVNERNIEIDFQSPNQFSNSSNSFTNPNQNSSPNFSPNSSQSLNSQPLLVEQQNQLKQKIQEQMQKQQKQLQKQMDELHQMRKELTEQTQQMQEQMALQMQQQMQIQQQNIQNMQLSMEKKKQMMQLELEKERKQMDNSKQLLELQMEREKDLMEKERAKMEKERQTLRQQRLLQEEELLQLKNQRELQQKEMQQLQRLQDLHKQQQQELQEQQEQHIQQRRELQQQQQQQQQSLSPSLNQQADIEQPQQDSFSTYVSRQVDPQQQFNPQQLQEPFQQDDPQSQQILNQETENFNLDGNENQSPPFPAQGSNGKSNKFDCKIFTDETIYLPPKKKQEQQDQNQPFPQDQANNFSSFSTNFSPIRDSNSNSAVNNYIQEEEEVADIGEPITGTQDDAKKGLTVASLDEQANGDATTSQFSNQDKINFSQEASLTANSNFNQNGILSEAVDKNNYNYPQTQYVSLDDNDVNVVLHRSNTNTDVSNKNINKILTFDKSTAPPLLNQTQEASPILKQQGRNVKSTNNFDSRNLNGLDDAENEYNNSNRIETNDDNDELLFQNLDQDQNDNQFYPRLTDLKIPKNIVA